jgi:hypothetical protein
MKVAAADWTCVGRCSILISSQRPTVVSEFYRGFIQPLQINSGILACFRLDHYRFFFSHTSRFASLLFPLLLRVYYNL